MSAAQRHNELAREFIMKVAGNTGSHAEMMVVIESVLFGSMLIMQRQYGFTPAITVEFIEAALLQATERFAAREV